MPNRLTDTRDPRYAERLARRGGTRWKQLLRVQAIYERGLMGLAPGRTLEVGCGVGRNLAFLGGAGVGIDHNERSVTMAKSRGFEAFTPDEFGSSYAANTSFDSLLFSHVLEHLSELDSLALVRCYLPYLSSQGRIIVITPQEAGYFSDPTHVRFMGFSEIARICEAVGSAVEMMKSFPLPRFVGRFFRYNEFLVVARLDSSTNTPGSPAGKSTPDGS